MKPMRVLLADDHALVRAGFRALLQNLPDVEVVAEAGEGHEALRLIESLQPDIALLDIAMPGLNGLETAARVAKEFPQVRVLLLSMHATEEYALQALHAGVAGYLIKDADPTELELALKAVSKGETYLSPPVSKHVIEGYLQHTANAPGKLTPYQRLTPRQREVLQLIAEGYTSPDIAHKLHISLRTVETHRQQIMERLDIHDLAGLVRYAIRIGLVTTD